jgi:serine O-acetyltransferase
MSDGSDVQKPRRPKRGLTERIGLVLLNSSVQAMILHRLAHWLHRARIPVLPALIRRINVSSTGADIHPGARIGKDVMFVHSVGIVIGEEVVVEDNVDIYSGVVLGRCGGTREDDGSPHILYNCVICSGAKVLGPVTVGPHATIAAGAVVLDNVPDHGLAVGVPARIVAAKTEGNSC